MKVDLHIHTTASDGNLSPKQIIDLAIKRGLKVIAITDHDTICGVNEAIKYAKEKNIEIIPGIEISCSEPELKIDNIHILGLFIDIKNKKLLELIGEIQKRKKKRLVLIKNAVKNFNFIGFKFFDKRALINFLSKKQVQFSKIKNYFRILLKRDKIGILKGVSIEKAINIIKNAKGISLLCHPGCINNANFSKLIDKCVKKKIDGIEVEYPYRIIYKIKKKEEEKIRKFIKKIAKEKKLLISGGSDFHGEIIRPVGIGEEGIEFDEFLKLKNFINKKR